MPSYFTRLRAALEPEYELEQEIASGGMGTVFLAREVALDRLVALKIVRPEQATAAATERFRREAITLAGLDHPNIVKVFSVGERDGFHYYTMQFLEGETLADRMRRHPLSQEEVRRIGRDLLDALEAAHDRDVIHRDIKPQNIFLKGDRAILVDFGIATASGPQTVVREGSDVVPGTPGYMPPEQRYGWDVGPQTDIYAVGMVLYEALTRRRWMWFLPDDVPDWTGIPWWTMQPALKRALAFEASGRWDSARSFRRVWWGRRTARYKRDTALLTAGGVVAGVLAAALIRPTGVAPADLAILPFAVDGADARLGAELAYLTHTYVQWNPQVSLAPAQAGPLDSTRAASEGARARARTSGMLRLEGSRVTIALAILGRDDTIPIPEVSGDTARISDLACRLAWEIVHALEPAAAEFECIPRLEGTPAQAIALFLDGERAFREQAFAKAETLYTAALGIDPTFTWARWRLINARRWQRESFTEDLDTLYERHGRELPEIDRRLLDIWRTPYGPERFSLYEQVLARFPREPYPWLMYGEDLFHRGPLAGIPQDSARVVLRAALDRDPTMGPALLLLTWEAIRAGDAAAAERWIGRLRASERPEATIPIEFLELAAVERFGPDDRRDVMRATLIAQGEGDPSGLGSFLEWLRFGLAFDAAPGQAWFAEALLGSPYAADPGLRVHLSEARAVALVALGRFQEALAGFDSVAAMSGDPHARLQAAQWRVLPAALGLEGFDADGAERGRAALRELADDPTVRAGALWSLAVDAYRRGDPGEGQRRLARLRQQHPDRDDLIGFIEALHEATLGRPEQALALTDQQRARWADDALEPFFRSVLFLTRARWQEQTDGSPVRELIWFQNSDLRGYASGPALQAGEIDWALANHARLRLARLRTARESRTAVCRDLDLVVTQWAGADPALGAARTEAQERWSARCR